MMGTLITDGLWVSGRTGADVNLGVATELKVKVGSETGMMGATEKLRATVGSEVETAGGMESGVDTEGGPDSKLTINASGDIGETVGTKAGVGSAMASTAADVGVETGSIMVGTGTGADAVAAAGAEVCMIVETIPSACAVVSEFSAPANVQLGIARVGTERVE